MHSTHEMSQLKIQNAVADDDYTYIEPFRPNNGCNKQCFFRIDFPQLCHWDAASKENVINLLTDISNQKFTLDAH